MRLGILTSHPIQYQAPWFRALAQRAELKVFFAHRQSAAEQGKAGFGKAFEWDVNLLDGYEYHFLNNTSKSPSVDFFDGCDTPDIAEIIRAGKFNAFIVNGWYLKSYRQAMRACRAAGVPIFVRGDSQLGTRRSLVKRLAMEVKQRWLLRQFDGFLTVGQRNREYLEHFGVAPEKIFFAPHFVDNEWFAAKANEVRNQRVEVRKSWGANEATIVALFVGKFIEKKSPSDLLRAVAIYNSNSNSLNVGASGATPNILPVFVGSGELKHRLQAEAKQLRVEAVFTGFKNQSELPLCYASADVLVLPSDGGETWGLVVNEAMACGCPAIVSDAVGCAPDLIEDDKTGSVFPVGNTEALAQRLYVIASRIQAGHDFKPALNEKLARYSVARAVAGTLEAVNAIQPK